MSFRVSLNNRLPRGRSVEKAVRLLRSRDNYFSGRYIDRYMVATVFKETGRPEFLADMDIKEEISGLRKAAVVAREVPNVVSFIDYDIVIYNYIELNGKEGYQSRVIREARA